MKESYLTISGQHSVEYIIQKSRFIATAKHIENVDEANDFLKEIKQKYSDATHNCYAYISDILGNEMRYQDAGEPQGTAGLPILEIIKNKKLFQIAIVVTRYFGGIKLGAGGLTRAYATSAAMVLENATIVNKRLSIAMELILEFTVFNKIEKYLNTPDVVITNKTYLDKAHIFVIVPTSNVDSFKAFVTEKANGKIIINKYEKNYY